MVPSPAAGETRHGLHVEGVREGIDVNLYGLSNLQFVGEALRNIAAQFQRIFGDHGEQLTARMNVLTDRDETPGDRTAQG